MRSSLTKCFLKCFNRKGQALLVLIIFLAITLLLITSISFSAIKSSEIVRRNVNFQTSFDKAESLIDKASNNIDNGDSKSIKDYDGFNRLVGNADINLMKGEFVDVTKDQSINVDLNEQASDASGTNVTTGINPSTMEIACKPGATDVELTFVYKSAGAFAIDKKLYICGTAGTGANISGATLLTATSSDGTYAYSNVSIASYNPLYLVRVKSYGTAASTVRLKITSGAENYGTAKYVITSSGVEQDGSASSTIQVEKAAGYYLPPIFDYVFYQGG